MHISVSYFQSNTYHHILYPLKLLFLWFSRCFVFFVFPLAKSNFHFDSFIRTPDGVIRVNTWQGRAALHSCSCRLDKKMMRSILKLKLIQTKRHQNNGIRRFFAVKLATAGTIANTTKFRTAVKATKSKDGLHVLLENPATNIVWYPVMLIGMLND